MNPKRLIRHDAHIVSNQEAKTWIAEYGFVVDITLKRMKPAAKRSRWYDESDLRNVGLFAIIEAMNSFDESKGAALRTWVGRVVQWRMDAAVQESFSDGRGRDPDEPMPDWACERITEPVSSDDVYVLASKIGDLIAELELQDKHIFLEHLMNESAAKIGGQIGLSGYQVRQRIAVIEGKLREKIQQSSALALEGTIEVGLDGESFVVLVTEIE